MRPAKHIYDEKTIRYRHNLKLLTKFLKKHIYLIAAAMAMYVFFYDLLDSWSGYYLDGDGYTRALRVYHWLLAPSFWEQPLYESNYPFGAVSHWTRPMDIIWILFTLPFRFYDNLKEIVYISGAFIAPCLGVLTVLTFVYGLQRVFNIYLVFVGCYFLLTDTSILSYILPSRPDHHALMLLLSAYGEALILCWLKKRHDRYLRILGIISALMVFTVAEGLLIYALFISFFLYLYIFKNISMQPIIKISKYFALALTIFWLSNPPYEGWFYPDNGRLSILYVAASWLALIGFKILDISRLHTLLIKLLCLWSIALGFALTLTVIFGPDIFSFPVDKELQPIFHSRISEYRSLKQSSICFAISAWLYPLIAILLSLYMLKFRPYKRLMILNLCLGLPLLLISLYMHRFLNYEHLYIILPFLALLDHLYKKSDFYKNKNLEFPGYIYGIILLIVAIQIGVKMPRQLEIANRSRTIVFTSEICQKVKAIGGTLATDVFLSPEYVWQCNVNTVGTCYHKNREGILDTHKLLTAETAGEAIPLILKHQITQILLFDDYAKDYYKMDEKNQNKLYYRLLKKENLPPFVEPVPTISSKAHLYKIKI